MTGVPLSPIYFFSFLNGLIFVIHDYNEHSPEYEISIIW